jgi:DNA-directed RNA polymerase subunit RPC12/RpoP
MEFRFHNLPLTIPFEYWCYQCGTMNLSLVPLNACPACNGSILKGEPGQLDKEQLCRDFDTKKTTKG